MSQPIRTFQAGKLPVAVYPTNEALGLAAAGVLSSILHDEIARRGEASVILATGNSQLTFMRSLRSRSDIAWGKIDLFHMDEYLGMSDQHPASFRRYIREMLVDHVHPRAFYGINGDAMDAEAEIARYTAMLAGQRPVACVMGIGENGHLAFNDPPADFTTRATMHIVNLDEACRRQQVGEGHFASLDNVPKQALSLTVPALLEPPHLLIVVPETRKAAVVKTALEGPITPNCPASILRTCAHARLFLDVDSASALSV